MSKKTTLLDVVESLQKKSTITSEVKLKLIRTVDRLTLMKKLADAAGHDFNPNAIDIAAILQKPKMMRILESMNGIDESDDEK